MQQRLIQILPVVFIGASLFLFSYHRENDLLLWVFILAVLLSLVLLSIQGRKMNRILKETIDSIGYKGEEALSYESLPIFVSQSNKRVKIVSEHIKQLGNFKELKEVPAELLKEEIGQALHSVQLHIKKMRDEEDRQHWVTEGLANFAEVLRKKESVKEYCSKIINALVKYIGANQGSIFLEYEYEGSRCLELEACYAYDRKRFLEKRIYQGEGLLGQCMFEKDIVFVTDVPEGYVNITSGLGTAIPRNIIVVPLMLNEGFYGAFELACFELLEDHQIEFLRKVSVMIASEIGAIKTLEHTKGLLFESDKLSEKLRAQEEEMKTNIEELTVVQEEMQRNQIELEKKQAELSSYMSAIDNTIASAEFELNGNISNANNLFLTITGYSLAVLKEKSYEQLFIDDTSLRVMWENLQLGKFFSGEFRMNNKDGKEMWLNGTLNPILDSEGMPEKIMLFAQFTTQEKEKVNDLGGMVHALKNTLPVIECSVDFQCKSANEKFLKLFSLGRLDLKNKKICDFMPHQRFCEEFDKRKSVLMSSNNVQLSMDFVISDEVKSWDVSVSVIRDLSGNISKIVFMLVQESEKLVA